MVRARDRRTLRWRRRGDHQNGHDGTDLVDGADRGAGPGEVGRTELAEQDVEGEHQQHRVRQGEHECRQHRYAGDKPGLQQVFTPGERRPEHHHQGVQGHGDESAEGPYRLRQWVRRPGFDDDDRRHGGRYRERCCSCCSSMGANSYPPQRVSCRCHAPPVRAKNSLRRHPPQTVSAPPREDLLTAGCYRFWPPPPADGPPGRRTRRSGVRRS